MKNLTYVSFALLLFAVVLSACDKKDLAPVYTGQIIASSRSVLKNQPDSLIIVGAEKKTIEWSIEPATYTIIKKDANKIVVSFSQFGVYTINAKVNGGKALTQTISCNDIPDSYTTIPLDNEDLILTPQLYKLSTSDSTYFNFKIVTSKTHQCSNSGFSLSQTQNKNNYIVYIDGLLQPKTDCTVANNTIAGVTNFFYPQVDEPITLGTSYPLTVNVGTKTYIGSVVFSKTSMDITWGYTSGVTMSVKHVNVGPL